MHRGSHRNSRDALPSEWELGGGACVSFSRLLILRRLPLPALPVNDEMMRETRSSVYELYVYLTCAEYGVLTWRHTRRMNVKDLNRSTPTVFT